MGCAQPTRIGEEVRNKKSKKEKYHEETGPTGRNTSDGDEFDGRRRVVRNWERSWWPVEELLLRARWRRSVWRQR